VRAVPERQFVRRRWRVLVKAGIAITAAVGGVVLVWWMFSATRGSPPGFEPSLANSTEGRLVYPAAQNVRRSGVSSECRDGLWQPALIEVTFTTADTTQTVDEWYLHQLAPFGWRSQGDPAPSYALDRGNNDEYFFIYKTGSEVMTGFQQAVKTGHC
jgi:hypothetical protein